MSLQLIDELFLFFRVECLDTGRLTRKFNLFLDVVELEASFRLDFLNEKLGEVPY